MIIIYKFASGSCDSTNIFGHAAISFTGLGDNSFAISEMADDKSDPIWDKTGKFWEKWG